MRALVILGLTVTSLLGAFARAEVSCGKAVDAKVVYGWCIHRDPQSRNPDVLYYMHGGGGSETAWSDSGLEASLSELWRTIGHDRPTVITVSFGRSWLLTDLESQGQPALLPYMAESIMPALEQKIGGVRGERLLVGPSMGGYNGAELALRQPHLFRRVALLCPGLGVVDPFLSAEEIEEFILTLPGSVDPENVRGIARWVREEFLTQENWSRHDPQQLADRAVRPATAFYVSCSKDDDYGFYPLAKRFAEVLATKTKSRFVSIESGGHCAQSEESWRTLAEFLAGKD